MKPVVFTVSRVNRYIKAMLEDDVVLQGLFVEAEISNFKTHASGHMYFTLKDEKAAMAAVMFRNYAQGLVFVPENGLKVIVYGTISLYDKTGQYQLYVEMMDPAGAGAHALAFEQMKAKLDKEGLFAQANKKAIPPYPRCVAIVTSPTGAAVHDVITVAKRRNKNVALVVVPALVQGDGATESIAEAIKTVNRWGRADVVIVGRGGGAAEDLWAFNTEEVARAIFASKIPIISAVGHETDVTIADFVADMRAPTPSAAAELAVFQEGALLQRLTTVRAALEQNIERVFAVRDDIRFAVQEMDRVLTRKIRDSQTHLVHLANLLHHLSPLTVLSRGYALVYNKNGRAIRTAVQAVPGQALTIRLGDGTIKSTVTHVEINSEG